MRGGFYPAPTEAIAHAGTFLRPPASGPLAVLDPCAGEGAAIRQLGELLGCPQASTFAIELDDSRAQVLREALAEAHVLAPASFFGCRASMNSFSLVWLNPPFDNGYSGNRMELQFLLTATDWLMPGGVMALVCPEDVGCQYSSAREHFITYYENCSIVPFPEEHRRFNEVIVFGHKRRRPQAEEDDMAWEAVKAPDGFVYQIPAGPSPRVFQKVEPTEPELHQMLANSPLRSHLLAPAEMSLPSPPLALGIGHVALLLASGQLDGVVHPDGRPTHVVRGTSRKRQFISDVTESEEADGGTATRTTISERVELVVRAVDLTGRIRTFIDTDGEEPEQRRDDNADEAGTDGS
jgi:hypothetical protein